MITLVMILLGSNKKCRDFSCRPKRKKKEKKEKKELLTPS